jgi:hypothetical protein
MNSNNELNNIIALAQIIAESGGRIMAIKNISKLLDKTLEQAQSIVDWFLSNQSLNISFTVKEEKK